MKHFPARIGLFLLLLLSAAGAGAQQGLGGLQLYEKMRAITMSEIALEEVDDHIISYIVQLAEQENMKPQNTTASMHEIVKAAFEARLADFCEMYNATFDGCPQVYQMFRDWARDIIETRTLSMDLLHIATGYETGVSGHMGEIFTVAERTLAIRNLWRSQDDALLTPEVFPLVRAVPRPESVTDGMFDDLAAELKADMPHAVWRYRYGIQAFGEYCHNTQDASELFEAVRERYCSVEEKLRALRDALPASPLEYDPPLRRGEIVIFPLRKLDDPPHVVVWMMAEHVDGTVKRDAGVGWDLALESVPIGILGEPPCDTGTLSESYCTVVERFSIRPGGRYEAPPEEPKQGEGICHLAFARDGYMCRPLRHDRCNAEIEDKDPRSIVLTTCEPSQAKQPVGLTESGPDICRTGWWRIPGKDILQSSSSSSTQKSECSLCTLDLKCESVCKDGIPAYTDKKTAEGKIHICITNTYPRTALAGVIAHELVHAQQLCNLAAETDIFDTAEHCCAREAEAYQVSCRIFAEDGILDEAGLSMEECVSGSANLSCQEHGENVCSDLVGATIKEKIEEVVRKRDETATNALPSCDEAIGSDEGMARLDSRILSMIEALNGACTPGCPVKYENTIGNNLCYIGQCVEQSIEQSRVIPGRMALVVGDESFPWDACAAENTQTAGLITLPAISPPLTPSYNPRLLVESLDRALCQINGLPAFTPPIRCQFDYQRRLSVPTSDYASTTLSFTSQIDENEDPTSSLQRMTQGIATRIGTSLLTRYLSWAGPALSDTLRTTNRLLNIMEQTKFPMQTCPRNAAEEPEFCEASTSPSE